MKVKHLILAVVTIALAVGMGNTMAATNDVSATLQKGLFEEEANRNLDAAIQAYQAVVAATDKDRQYAATAVFRLGECYRKQGKTNEATIQYQRIVREFPEQTDLVKLSREQLGPVEEAPSAVQPIVAGTTFAAENQRQKLMLAELNSRLAVEKAEYTKLRTTYPLHDSIVVAKQAKIATLTQQIHALEEAMLANQAAAVTPSVAYLKGLSNTEKRRVAMAVQQQFPNPVLDSLMQKLTKAEQDLAGLKSSLGDQNPSVVEKEAELKVIYEQFDAQLYAVMAAQAIQATPAKPVRVDLNPPFDPEQEEVKRIQAMIKDSPDLINAPTSPVFGKGPPLFEAAQNNQLVVAKFLLDNKADIEGRNFQDEATPLLIAVEHGHKEVVELLLEHGADANARIKYIGRQELPMSGATPLNLAAEKGYREIAALLLAHGAKINAGDDGGQTALYLAAEKGFKSVAELLLEHGPDVNARTRTGDTALHVAAYAGNTAIVELMLANKANVNAAVNSGETPLYIAAQSGRQSIAELLLLHQANINAPTTTGATPLMVAIEKNHPDIAQLLLAHGADVKAQTLQDAPGRNYNTHNGWTALHFAVVGNDAEMATALLAKGADPDLTGNFQANVNPGHDGNFSSSHHFTPLMMAIFNEKKDLAQILIAHKASVNFKNAEGVTPLLEAVRHNSKDMVALLLDAKADTTITDKDGWSPLQNALVENFQNAGTGNQKEIVELLLTHGANPNSKWPEKSAGSFAGYTPLRYAVAAKEKEIVEMLLAHGADINLPATDGRTPIYEARENTMVELLAAHGANVNFMDTNSLSPLDYLGSADIREALRQHGAISALERRTIRITRAGQTAQGAVFWQDTGTNNHHTLYEVLAYAYPNQVTLLDSKLHPQPELPGFHFPDFAQVKIHHRKADGHTNVSTVDLQTALTAGDCSKNLRLSWGDVVELPELEHNVSASWDGLSQPIAESLKKCLERHVEIVVKGKSTRLTLAPTIPEPRTGGVVLPLPAGAAYTVSPFGTQDTSPKTELANFWLDNVVQMSRLILTSSDLSRVKVKRVESGKTRELVFNLDKHDFHTDLWLEDGDVIEIPEK